MSKKNLKYQAEKRLEKMCCFGTSKYKYKGEAKVNNTNTNNPTTSRN